MGYKWSPERRAKQMATLSRKKKQKDKPTAKQLRELNKKSDRLLKDLEQKEKEATTTVTGRVVTSTPNFETVDEPIRYRRKKTLAKIDAVDAIFNKVTVVRVELSPHTVALARMALDNILTDLIELKKQL